MADYSFSSTSVNIRRIVNVSLLHQPVLGVKMTQKELIDKVHGEMSGKVPFAEVIHRIAKVITQEGEINFCTMFARLEPASSAYVKTYPDDISDGPWDI